MTTEDQTPPAPASDPGFLKEVIAPALRWTLLSTTVLTSAGTVIFDGVVSANQGANMLGAAARHLNASCLSPASRFRKLVLCPAAAVADVTTGIFGTPNALPRETTVRPKAQRIAPARPQPPSLNRS